MGIYVNRTLNLKQIQAIGFDMDYTLVRYNSREFEELTYKSIIKKLISEKNYPKQIEKLEFHFEYAIRGLVIDKPYGNVLKLSTYSRVKQSYHGLKELDYKSQQEIYRGLVIDLNDTSRYAIVDTTFSVAYCNLYMQLVDLKDAKPDLELPDYKTLESDVLECLDISHRDGTLKDEVGKNIKKYIIQDPKIVQLLERFKKHQKKLWVITNSDYSYTKLLLDYAINPHLKKHKHWSELFDVVITFASKPRFFTDKLPFLAINPKDGTLRNYEGLVQAGIYQGGCATTLQKCFNLHGEQILYLGDHIYGDVLQIKKTCNWRTALVIDELRAEQESLQNSMAYSQSIQELMEKKIEVEKSIDQYFDTQIEKNKAPVKEKVQPMFNEIEKLDKKIGKLLRKQNQEFNPYWGETMRAGVEPSRLSGQIEKYACIYMSKVSDLIDYSPRTYFRPHRKVLPHEVDSTR